jgi:hypothetical protein
LWLAVSVSNWIILQKTAETELPKGMLTR